MILKFEEIEKRHKRTYTFFKFLYYNWGDDDDEGETEQQDKQKDSKKEVKEGTKEWEIYKEVNLFETKDKYGKQALKRDFYNKHVDK